MCRIHKRKVELESCRTCRGGVHADDNVPCNEDGREDCSPGVGGIEARNGCSAVGRMTWRRKKKGDSKWIRQVLGVYLVQYAVGSGYRV